MNEMYRKLIRATLYPSLLKMYTDIFCQCESYARVISTYEDGDYKEAWEEILKVDAKAKKDATDISDEIVKEANERGIYGNGGEEDE